MRIPTNDPLVVVPATIPGIAAAQGTQIARGTIRAFNATTYEATVQLAGSAATWLPGVPVAATVGLGLIRPGARCAIAFFNPADPRDAVIFAVFGRPPGTGDPDWAVLNSSLLNTAVLAGAALFRLDREILNGGVLG